ncbi:MAG: hypothetical protein M1816_000768 [Peltula sp. TS41687]|nr:MAG: hypothetical protein M1816_000768 [Peltula sp. TS41687]
MNMILSQLLLPVVFFFSVSQAAETILGLYVYSRHGDRSDKSHPPAILYNLGYSEMFSSGQYFRNQYVSSNSPGRIEGISSDEVDLSQISVQAPMNAVLMTLAQAFLQGLYPPVGSQEESDTLRNGTTIYAPLNGYQLIPIYTSDQGGGSEDQPWLQATSNCANALTSSNAYYSSQDYMDMFLESVVDETYSGSRNSFKNAYAVYDIINVALIHNKTIPASELITPDVLFQLRTLADHQQFNLAYNASETVRAIPGATLAAQVVEHLNNTIHARGKSNKIGIQFGAYASFLSFFGLSQLPAADPDFYGIPDYASTMTFELFTTTAADPASAFPDVKDLQVRFRFHNGSASDATSQPAIAYPLFGRKETALPWSTFADKMNRFAVGSSEAWCRACGNTTGECAGGAHSSPAQQTRPDGDRKGNGISKAVAGVIGAMVTLAVVLGVEASILLTTGLRLTRKEKKNHPHHHNKTLESSSSDGSSSGSSLTGPTGEKRWAKMSGFIRSGSS